MIVRALAAFTRGAPLAPHRFDPGSLAATDVEVRVASVALCHSDLHLIDDDWGISRYPLVPGHEIIGRVERVGAGVSGLNVGDRVGIGWQRSSCGTCALCRTGFENLCAVAKRRTCVDQPGGFAELVRADQCFALPIPDATEDEAAPLLCAGVTVHAPLARHLPNPGRRVAVVGLGGLGHLAVKFARAMGHEVTVFDPDSSKASEARSLGAESFVGGEPARHSPTGEGGDFDFVLVTTSANLNWDEWLAKVAYNGTLCLVGIPSKPLVFAADHVLDGQKRVTGSVVGSPSMQRAMLEFAARHDIRPTVEVSRLSEVNDAIRRLREGRVRYRAVLTNDL